MKAKKKRARLSALITTLQKDLDQYGDVWVTFTLSADMLAQVWTPTAAVRRFTYTYKLVMHGSRRVIEATDQDGQTTLMTCGINPTAEEVLEKIRMLRIDDDNIDAKKGYPRKLQG
jgi:hypothetical protein